MANSKIEPAILAENISKSFGEVQALKNVNLTVFPGTVLSLLGPNRAGKTTLIRILTTYYCKIQEKPQLEVSMLSKNQKNLE